MLLQKFPWNTAVLKATEPVLVVFTAGWFSSCRRLKPILDRLSLDFKVCQVNVECNPELTAHYGIASVPTWMIFKEGWIVARHVGMTPEATLREGMTALSLIQREPALAIGR